MEKEASEVCTCIKRRLNPPNHSIGSSYINHPMTRVSGVRCCTRHVPVNWCPLIHDDKFACKPIPKNWPCLREGRYPDEFFVGRISRRRKNELAVEIGWHDSQTELTWLTHYPLVSLYCIMCLGQHWFRLWSGDWQPHVTTRTNVDFTICGLT